MKLIKIIFIISLLNLILFFSIGLFQKKPTTVTVSGIRPQSVPTTTPDNRCLITVNGQLYDVTFFKTIHSGGDVFQCGTDMSSVFRQQHNQRYLDLMSMYKI